jgi:hypothetical protein
METPKTAIIPKKLNQLYNELETLTAWMLAPRTEEFINSCAYREEYEEKFWEQEELKKLIAIEERRNVNVGEGVTVYFKTFNTHAYTVVRRTKNKLFIQRDTARVKDSLKPEPEYTYTPNSDNPIDTAYWNEERGCFVYEDCRVENGRCKIERVTYVNGKMLLQNK